MLKSWNGMEFVILANVKVTGGESLGPEVLPLDPPDWLYARHQQR